MLNNPTFLGELSMTSITEAASKIHEFEQNDLGSRISFIETHLRGLDRNACKSFCLTTNITPTLIDSALVLKKLAGQINVIIHTVGILMALPYILDEGEFIQDLSLGAGNSGKPFDLETNRRIAEFKFIHWKGGAESIRQNQLFKDFYLLAEYETSKNRYLYVIGTDYPLKFLNGNRSISSVMSRNNKLWADFQDRYKGRFMRVKEYFDYRKSRVNLQDLGNWVPQFRKASSFPVEEEIDDEDI